MLLTLVETVARTFCMYFELQKFGNDSKVRGLLGNSCFDYIIWLMSEENPFKLEKKLMNISKNFAFFACELQIIQENWSVFSNRITPVIFATTQTKL